LSTTLPPGFTVRPAAMDDLKPVLALINAREIEDRGTARTTEEDLRHTWQASHFTLASDTWVVLTPEGNIVAYADLFDIEHVRLYVFICVSPDYYGQGIRTHLLHFAEKRASQIAVEAPPDQRVSLEAQIVETNKAEQQFFAQAGYTVVRSSWRMGITLHEPPSPPELPTGITLHTFRLGQDDHATFHAFNEAFRDLWGFVPVNFEYWSHETIKKEDFDPTLWFLAWDGDEIVGLSCCNYRPSNIGWVDDLAVRRPWRRNGVGLALLLRSFAEFYRRGTPDVQLSVDSQSLTGATRLYKRAGMHVIYSNLTYEKEVRPGKNVRTQSITV